MAFNGDRQRFVVSGASDKLLTIEAPNTVQANTVQPSTETAGPG